jgi:hypothetical protein
MFVSFSILQEDEEYILSRNNSIIMQKQNALLQKYINLFRQDNIYDSNVVMITSSLACLDAYLKFMVGVVPSVSLSGDDGSKSIPSAMLFRMLRVLLYILYCTQQAIIPSISAAAIGVLGTLFHLYGGTIYAKPPNEFGVSKQFFDEQRFDRDICKSTFLNV